MTNIIKPLRAKKAEFDKIRWPVLGTPKLDGIRCLMVDGVAHSKSMKPIPNEFVRAELAGLHGLDGELMVNGDYNAVQSAIMKRTGEPDFYYKVFDSFQLGHGYADRIAALEDTALDLTHPRVSYLLPVLLKDQQALDAYTDKCIAEGYEGVMIREPNGRYKFGQSTVREGLLLKVKRFKDDEATLVDIVEKMHNGNELGVNELGGAKRSSHKANLVPAGTSGGVILEWNGLEFSAGFGPGITDAIKQDWWDRRQELCGSMVKFSYQDLSATGVPRFGKMLGFRTAEDM